MTGQIISHYKIEEYSNNHSLHLCDYLYSHGDVDIRREIPSLSPAEYSASQRHLILHTKVPQSSGP